MISFLDYSILEMLGEFEYQYLWQTEAPVPSGILNELDFWLMRGNNAVSRF